MVTRPRQPIARGGSNNLTPRTVATAAASTGENASTTGGNASSISSIRAARMNERARALAATGPGAIDPNVPNYLPTPNYGFRTMMMMAPPFNGPNPNGPNPVVTELQRQSRIQQAVNMRNQFWDIGLMANLSSPAAPTQQGAAAAAAGRGGSRRTPRYRHFSMAEDISIDDDLDDYDDDDEFDIDVSSISFNPDRALERQYLSQLSSMTMSMTPYSQNLTHEYAAAERRRLAEAESAAAAKEQAAKEKEQAKTLNTDNKTAGTPEEVQPEPEVLPPTFRWVTIEIVDAPKN